MLLESAIKGFNFSNVIHYHGWKFSDVKISWKLILTAYWAVIYWLIPAFWNSRWAL